LLGVRQMETGVPACHARNHALDSAHHQCPSCRLQGPVQKMLTDPTGAGSSSAAYLYPCRIGHSGRLDTVQTRQHGSATAATTRVCCSRRELLLSRPKPSWPRDRDTKSSERYCCCSDLSESSRSIQVRDWRGREM